MATALLTHPDCDGHVTPAGHPERVDRLAAVRERLDAPAFAGLLRETAPMADEADLRLAHPDRYIARIRDTIPAAGHAALDADTYLAPGSWAAALRAAGANRRAVDLVLSGEAANAFAATRPPGHHAERETAMGFCLFGNAVIAARHALERHGLARVAIVDFDVHHGNGTQDLAWDDPRILYASTHQMPLFPGTGASGERGAHDNIVNLPLPPGTQSAAFRSAVERQILPALDAFAPELVVISAGFDAHAADPLAQMELTTEDFAWITAAAAELAARHCAGRVVSTLEGGYDLGALADGVAAHLGALMERSA